MPRAVAMEMRDRMRKKINSRVIITFWGIQESKYTSIPVESFLFTCLPVYLSTFLLILWILHLRYRAPVVFARFRRLWCEHLGGWDRFQQHLLVINGRTPVKERKLIVIAQHDRFGGTGIFAIAAVDTADHVNFVGRGIALAWREASFIRILSRFHKDRVCRAGCRAQ